MKERGQLKYRLDGSGRCLFFLGVLLATSVTLSVAAVFVEKDHDDVDDYDHDITRNDDIGRPFAAGVPASRNTRFVPSAEAPRRMRQKHSAVSEVLTNVDEAVNPCDDFYQFSCYYDRFVEIEDQLKGHLKDLLTDDNATKSFIRKAKNLYQSCMDEDKLKERGNDPLRSVLSQIFLVPQTSVNSLNSFDLESLLGSLSVMELFPLITINIDIDDYDSSRHIAHIFRAELGMERKNMLQGRQSRMVTAYEELKRQHAEHLLRSTDFEIKNISDVVDFEIKLAEFTAPPEKSEPDFTYKKLTVSELRSLFPTFDWMKYLSKYFAAANAAVTEHTEVILMAENYVRKMLQLYETTDKRTVLNYLLLRTVDDYAQYMSKNIRDLELPFQEVLKGQTQAADRWKTCVEMVIYFMPEAVGQLYVATHFPSSSKDKILVMTGYIKESMKQMISEVHWMDDETKIKTKEKIDVMAESIGYPDNQFDNAMMWELYKDVDYQPDTCFQNAVDGAHSKARIGIEKLQRSPRKTDWHLSAAVVDAFYSPSQNQISFPAGILQPPFYDERLPMSMRFGAIGMVIGHEITHGFDNAGREHDKDGNKQLWWSNHSINNFKKLIPCYVEQYNNQEIIPGVYANGKIGLGENIADNGGIKAAFLAFKKWQSDNEEQSDQALNQGYSQDQLFFISFAQCMCILMKEEYIRSRVNVHNLNSVRARVSVSNSEHFAKAFNCSRGSHMNPSEKCELW